MNDNKNYIIKKIELPWSFISFTIKKRNGILDKSIYKLGLEYRHYRSVKEKAISKPEMWNTNLANNHQFTFDLFKIQGWIIIKIKGKL